MFISTGDDGTDRTDGVYRPNHWLVWNDYKRKSPSERTANGSYGREFLGITSQILAAMRAPIGWIGWIRWIEEPPRSRRGEA